MIRTKFRSNFLMEDHLEKRPTAFLDLVTVTITHYSNSRGRRNEANEFLDEPKGQRIVSL
jgi:hypothetical protein